MPYLSIQKIRTISICLLFLLIAGRSAPAADVQGKTHFYLHQTPAFDTYTNRTDVNFWNWMNQYVWRAGEYTTYFDTLLSKYRNAFVYDDAYAIYNNGSGWVITHPEWILRTGPGNSGQKVFLDYACGGGTCPQYAADVSNADFRNAWIAQARIYLNKGYKGLLIDDVNLAFRFSNGTSNVVPYDVNTHKAMLESDWQKYMAQFMVAIRNAFPAAEIVHNTIWFAGGNDVATRALNPYVAMEQSAANYINLERGTGDAGLTGGTGFWSLTELLNFIDRAHSRGPGVFLDDYGTTGEAWNYALASYLLVSTGRDAVGAQGVDPDHWWAGFSVDLGAPLGERYTDAKGLLHRDYFGGIVILNPPGGTMQTIALSKTYRTIDGGTTTSVTLGPKQGIVLLN
jgi:hypothetical protein